MKVLHLVLLSTLFSAIVGVASNHRLLFRDKFFNRISEDPIGRIIPFS